jgi:hypothetical protein
MMFLWDVVSCSVVKVDQHFIHVYYFHEEPGSSVSILSGYGLDDRAIGVRSPAGAKDFYSNLWPTQPPVRWVPGVLSPGHSAAGA